MVRFDVWDDGWTFFLSVLFLKQEWDDSLPAGGIIGKSVQIPLVIEESDHQLIQDNETTDK